MKIEVGGEAVYAYTGSRSLDAALPTIVFVHGAGLDHSVWALQSRYFAHHGNNVLALDLPGHGRSGGAVRSSVGELADWLLANMDALRIERAALVGHSLGSLVALDMAGRFSARVTRLALLAPSVPMPVSDALLEAARSDEPLARALITQWSFAEVHRLGGNPQPGMSMAQSGLRLMERCAPGVLLTDLCACKDYGAGLERAAAVHASVLMILGERDLMAPSRDARALAAALSDVRSVTIPGSGHSLMSEAPDAVLDALRGFLSHDEVVPSASAPAKMQHE